MNKKLINELFQKPESDFLRFLEDVENARIIFSGKFGIGKTTFINYFFEKNESKYEVVRLFPVKYSIASNEDIMDLIKHDILMSIISNKIEFTSEDVSKIDTIIGFSKDNLIDIVKALIGCIPKMGKDINDTYKGLERLGVAFQDYYKNKVCDEGEKVLEYIDLIRNGKGLIYEDTFIVQIIQNKINDLKDRNSQKKEVVLVIDDLDRIDPEHVFRLFNVFAAHFDEASYGILSNKFGFDRVIFICDIDNVRSIFKHRYGVETDFGGYIDKFFSRKIFEFDNVYDTNNLIDIIVDRYHIQIERFDKNEVYNNLKIFLKVMLNLRIVNIRVLTKYIDNNNGIITEIPNKLRPSSFFTTCQIIRHLFGNDEELIYTLRNNNHLNIWEKQNVTIVKYLVDSSIPHLLDSEELVGIKNSETDYLIEGIHFYKNEYGFNHSNEDNKSIVVSILIRGIQQIKILINSEIL